MRIKITIRPMLSVVRPMVVFDEYYWGYDCYSQHRYGHELNDANEYQLRAVR